MRRFSERIHKRSWSAATSVAGRCRERFSLFGRHGKHYVFIRVDEPTVKIAVVMQHQFGTEGNGSTYTATRLVSELGRRGHDLTVYGTEEPPPQASERTDIDVRTVDVPESSAPYKTRFNEAIRDRMDEFDAFDITHAYDMQLLPAMGDMAAEAATKTAVTLQAFSAICPKNDLLYLNEEECTANGYLKCGRCTLTSLYRNNDAGFPTAAASAIRRSANRVKSLRSIRAANDDLDGIGGFHTYTDRLRETYVSFGYPDERITVIRNVLDDAFSVEHESDFAEPYRLLYVGRLATEKGVRKLLPLLSRLNERTPHAFTLTVAGRGYLRDELERAARSRGVEADVEFTGHIPHDEMPELYATHDLFVYPGIWNEPFGRVFLEALATGTPVVATDVGSVDEIIGDAGVVVEGSVDGLTDGITKIVEAAAFDALSSAGRSRVQNYRVADVLPAFESWYRRILDDGQDGTEASDPAQGENSTTRV